MKKAKLCVALSLCVALLICVFSTQAMATDEWNGYIPISSIEDLNNIRNDLSGKYYLTQDIIFPTDQANNWEPIGYYYDTFTGVLDGNGHRIVGLRIDKEVAFSTVYVGLFAYCQGEIRNLGLEDCRYNVTLTYDATAYIGGIVGRLGGGTVSQCYFTGSITTPSGGTARLGGIVAEALDYDYKNPQIIDCFNLATIDGGMYAKNRWLGGIVASNEGLVTHCYNAGKLTSLYPRGIVGMDSYSIITENYYLANGATNTSSTELTHEQMQVEDSFVGLDFTNTWCFRNENGYNYPELKNVPLKMDIDSISIEEEPNGIIYNEKNGTAKSGGGTIGLNYTNSFVVLDDLSIAKVTGITSGKYGKQNVTFTYAGKSVEGSYTISPVASGNGTADSPYCISKLEHLNSVRLDLGAHYKLTKNLEFTKSDYAKKGAFYNDGKFWLPIGENEENAFKGVFDGGNKTISGLKINIDVDNAVAYVGMFGCVTGTVKNLRLSNVDIYAKAGPCYVGGIAGSLKNATVENCYIESGYINGTTDTFYKENWAQTGGIAGQAWYSTIKLCHNAAIVESGPVSSSGTSIYCGGIVGYQAGGITFSCYNIGDAYAICYESQWQTAFAGGIVGFLEGNVYNCYNTGRAVGSRYSGGIAGKSYGYVSGCYNTAAIDRGFAGGIVGYNEGSIDNCYYLDNTPNAVGELDGDATKCTAAKFKSKSTFKNFDFKETWTMDGSKGYDYPELQNNPMMVTAEITTQPKSKCAANGETIKVTISAKGDGLTYQWYIKAPSESKYTATTTKSKTYSLTMSKSLSGSKLYCVVTDKYGNSEKSNAITVSNLAIKTQPTGKAVANKKSVSVTVKATGTDLKYTWYIKDAKDKDYKKTSVTTATYKCTMDKSVNGRKLYCVVKDKYGNTVTTKTVTLSNLAVTSQPIGKAVANKKAASVSVKASGSGLTYTWYIKDVKDKSFKKTSVTSSTYKCTMTSSVNGRKVYCVIKDKYGYTVKTETVTLSCITITAQPASAKVANKKTASTTVKATGSGLTYTWYVKNTKDADYKKTSVKTATYKCTMSKSVNGRKAYCIVTDKYGNSVKTSTVTLKMK